MREAKETQEETNKIGEEVNIENQMATKKANENLFNKGFRLH